MSQIRNIVGDWQLYQEGFGLATLIEEITLPDIKWKAEDYHGGGLMGTRQIKSIFDKMKLGGKSAGFDPRMLNAVGQMPGMSSIWKIMASLIDPGLPEIPQKILVTGSMVELKRGTYKTGKQETTFEIDDITYYEEWFDGKLKFGFDLINQTLVVDGVDMMATRRRNTGRG
jgi:P2 family phage contractile tail tube protein